MEIYAIVVPTLYAFTAGFILGIGGSIFPIWWRSSRPYIVWLMPPILIALLAMFLANEPPRSSVVVWVFIGIWVAGVIFGFRTGLTYPPAKNFLESIARLFLGPPRT